MAVGARVRQTDGRILAESTAGELQYLLVVPATASWLARKASGTEVKAMVWLAFCISPSQLGVPVPPIRIVRYICWSQLMELKDPKVLIVPRLTEK